MRPINLIKFSADHQQNSWKEMGCVEERQASSRMAGNVLEAIYELNGMIIDALSQTNYDNQRISLK